MRPDASRVVYHQDFTGTATSNSSGARYDLYGHGTHVAGIIAGNGSLSGGEYAGVAPGATLIDLRALDANGAGTDSTVIAAIQQAIALKNTYNIRVINLSLGRGIPVSYTQDPLCQAVEAAWNNGIVVVVAAGNYGRSERERKQRIRNRDRSWQRSTGADGRRDQEQRIRLRCRRDQGQLQLEGPDDLRSRREA